MSIAIRGHDAVDIADGEDAVMRNHLYETSQRVVGQGRGLVHIQYEYGYAQSSC